MRDYIGATKGDTRSLDCCSCFVVWLWGHKRTQTIPSKSISTDLRTEGVFKRTCVCL